MAVKFLTDSHLVRWLKNVRLESSCCFLCHTPLSRSILCHPCQRDLPHNIQSCPFCALPNSQGLICPDCLTADRATLDWVVAPYRYDYPIDVLIQALKFGDRPGLANLFGDSFIDMDRAGLIERPECLVPVPLGRLRLRERGYNQAAYIARAISSRLGIPVIQRLLRRRRETLPQSNLAQQTRRRNIRGAFIPLAPRSRHFQHVALVDDVMTTGETLSEASRVLKEAGIQRVDAWVCARAGKETRYRDSQPTGHSFR